MEDKKAGKVKKKDQLDHAQDIIDRVVEASRKNKALNAISMLTIIELGLFVPILNCYTELDFVPAEEKESLIKSNQEAVASILDLSEKNIIDPHVKNQSGKLEVKQLAIFMGSYLYSKAFCTIDHRDMDPINVLAVAEELAVDYTIYGEVPEAFKGIPDNEIIQGISGGMYELHFKTSKTEQFAKVVKYQNQVIENRDAEKGKPDADQELREIVDTPELPDDYWDNMPEDVREFYVLIEDSISHFFERILRIVNPEQTSNKKNALEVEETVKNIASNVINNAIDNSNFLNIYNSPEYNRIHKGIGLKPLNIDRMGNQLRRNGNVDIIFYVEPEEIAKAEKRISATAAMMLDILMSEYTKTGFNDEMISIPLKEYMRIRDIKDAKTAREQINNDINALMRMEIKCESPIHGPLLVSPYGGTRSANKNYIKNSVIMFKFNSDWKKLFPYKQLLQIPSVTYKINPRYNPHSFYFMKKIAEHKRMNAGSGNENIMSVKSLVEASPTFPTYEDLGSKKHVSQRIIDPFERDLDILSKAVTWEYTDGQPGNYEQFINNKVKIIWENEPDYQTVIQGKIKRAKARAKAKKAAGGAKK